MKLNEKTGRALNLSNSSMEDKALAGEKKVLKNTEDKEKIIKKKAEDKPVKKEVKAKSSVKVDSGEQKKDMKKLSEKTVEKKIEKPIGKSSRGLGRGLDSLIPKGDSSHLEKKNSAEEVKSSDIKVKEVVKVVSGDIMLNINDVEPNPDQPRKKFDEDKLNELAESIEKHGIIEPIVVQKIGKRYQIIAGERRWRAARKAKLKEVPVVIKEYSDRERYEVSLIENVQRDDLNAIEEALAYQSLIDEFSMTHDEVAERVSKSRVAISNSIRLLKLDKRVQELVINDLISGGHARALLGINDPNTQFDCATRIIDEKLSVRETEKLVRSILNNKDNSGKKKASLDDVGIYREYEEKLRTVLGAKVQIQRKDNNKGKIVIEYNSSDEFEKLCDIIKR